MGVTHSRTLPIQRAPPVQWEVHRQTTHLLTLGSVPEKEIRTVDIPFAVSKRDTSVHNGRLDTVTWLAAVQPAGAQVQK